MIITEQMIDDIALGATVLGTGGGGDPYSGALMAKIALKRAEQPVRILPLEEVHDDWLTVPCSMIGAPTVAIEKLNSQYQMINALEAIETALGQNVSATFPIEVGGFNSLIPILVAANKNIPVVDCDAMGRAFPEAQMVTFFLDDLPSAPNTLADERGNVTTLYPVDGIWSEKLARPITEQMGGSASMCDYPMKGADLKRSSLGGTLTKAMQIGEAIRLANENNSSGTAAVTKIVDGHVIISGKITDIRRETDGGFAKGGLVIEHLSQFEHSGVESVYVHFQNELLLAHRGRSKADMNQQNLLACTPDLISILDHESGRPITTEQLKYGQRVDLIAYPCDPKWRTSRGLEVVGPDYFGYAVDYQSTEELREILKGHIDE